MGAFRQMNISFTLSVFVISTVVEFAPLTDAVATELPPVINSAKLVQIRTPKACKTTIVQNTVPFCGY